MRAHVMRAVLIRCQGVWPYIYSIEYEVYQRKSVHLARMDRDCTHAYSQPHTCIQAKMCIVHVCIVTCLWNVCLRISISS